MSLEKGARLGPYEIIGPLGAGGMGEVYRAQDARLGREVAIKVLPAEVADHPELLRRFEREARAASALNHPNIVTIFDAGREGDVSYLAMELVDGTSLRHLLDGRPMTARRLLPIAMQIADGLAAAHERGIVHRDLKPENIMVDRQGRARILDFGLAKDVSPPIADEASPTLTLEEGTREGTILGTAGYMSPEQASGRPADFHTDQFSFGAILYEMASGARAFRGSTPIETLASVIRDEPPPLRDRVPETPAPLCWVVERCLAKEPEQRYGSTRDLARDLATLRDHLTHGGSSPAVTGVLARRRKMPVAAAIVIAAALAAAGAFYGGMRRGKPKAPLYDQITFRRGRLFTARFAPGGDSIVYGAAWDGEPFDIFSTRGSGASGSRALGLRATDLLSVSRAGEMAVSVGRRFLGGFVYSGTLARVDLSGSAPREVLEEVSEADWTPDGAELAITRQGGRGFTLELPPGNVLFSTPGWIGQPRVSPDGRSVAFIHHPLSGDDRGEVDLVDRSGKLVVLAGGWTSVQGLAWQPDGDEIWFASSKTGINRALHAVSRGGRERTVLTMPASLFLQDIAPSGRVLLTRADVPVSLVVRPAPEASEIPLTWLDASIVRDISADGKTIVFTEAGQGGGPNCSVYLRRVGEPAAVRLGEGWAGGLSPDGKYVLGIDPARTPSLLIYPVGAGEVRPIAHPGIVDEWWAAWLPEGKRVAFAAHEKGEGPAIFVQDVAGGAARRATPPGIGIGQIESAGVSLSPDGTRVAVADAAGVLTLFDLGSAPPRPVPGAIPHEIPVGWDRDGSALFLSQGNRIPDPIVRVRLSDGRREPWRELAPIDPAGVGGVDPVILAPDGHAYAYSCLTYLSTLFVADGLR